MGRSLNDICVMFCLLLLHQIIIAFVVLVMLLTEEIPIPDNILGKMVMQTIDEFDLPPLSGKKQRQISLNQLIELRKHTYNTITSVQKKVSLVIGWVQYLDDPLAI
jgi:hypothetical protein